MSSVPPPPPPPPAGPPPGPPPGQPYPVPPPQQGRGMSGCAIAALVVTGVVVVGIIGFWIVAALVLGEAADELDDRARDYEAAQRDMEAIEAETGIETDSANLENPPQHDLEGEVTCELDRWPLQASGLVVNHSSETSSYTISVSFTERDGTRYDLATTSVNRVAPDEQVRWEVVALSATDPATVDVTECRVTHMNRFSSTFDVDDVSDPAG